MLKRALTTGVVALVAAACADTTTDPIGPIQAAVTKVALCHWDAPTGQFTSISVPVGGKPYQKHLAHGDGEPGGPVPGQAGYVFDDACVPVLAQRVFAIAYTDVNPDDGSGFKPGTDVLIAKLVDANNDGSLSNGDQVIRASYPTNYEATQFGGFAVTSHTVTTVWIARDYWLWLILPDGSFVNFWTGYLNADGSPQPFEMYNEYDTSLSGSLILRDEHVPDYIDWLIAVAGGAPSQPDTDAGPLYRAPSVDHDDGFIDVEINLSGL